MKKDWETERERKLKRIASTSLGKKGQVAGINNLRNVSCNSC